jgi:hypothetical protein
MGQTLLGGFPLRLRFFCAACDFCVNVFGFSAIFCASPLLLVPEKSGDGFRC